MGNFFDLLRRMALAIVMALVISLFTVIVAWPFLAGYEGYVVTTDSMASTLYKGDMIFVKPVTPDELTANQIVTMITEDGKGYLTHRIVSVNRSGGAIRTKGDANRTPDPKEIPMSRVVGAAVYRVPKIGMMTLGKKQ